jgi:carnitine O-acetyltransferase
MRDNSKTNEARKTLFMAATKRHINDAKEAGSAMGVDRHLLGLRMLVGENDG